MLPNSELSPAGIPGDPLQQAAVSADPARGPIAPWWHTGFVLFVLAVGSIASSYQHGLPNVNIPRLSVHLSGYLTVITEEWLLVLFIWLWLKRSGLSMASLTSGRWRTPRAFFRDLGLAFGFLLVGIPLTSGLTLLIGAHSGPTEIFPNTPWEAIVYFAAAVTAGFCEELLFRGYLLGQFAARANSRVFGVAMQGLIFGLAHGYQGRVMAVIFIYGCLFGAFVNWRKSLLPAMIAHGVQGAAGGLVDFFFLK
jgi:uncharacterized protein